MQELRKARTIIDEECAKQGITRGELSDAGRTRTYTQIRHKLVERLREETTLSWKEIAFLLGYNARPARQYRRLKQKVIHTPTTTTK